MVLVINEGERDRSIVDPQPHADDAGGPTPYDPDGLLMEPEAVPETGRKDDFSGVIGRDDIDELVALFEPDRVRPGRTGV